MLNGSAVGETIPGLRRAASSLEGGGFTAKPTVVARDVIDIEGEGVVDEGSGGRSFRTLSDHCGL